jgi:RNA polymerase sigma-70 factor (ECF subfamily)
MNTPDLPEPTERLVERARADPREGFGPLYARVAPAIYSWASLNIRAPLATDIDPEDLLQEVACRAYESFERYSAERSDFRAWIFGVARKVLHKALERLAGGTAGRLPRGSGDTVGLLPDDATTVSRRIARDEGVARFLARVDELPEEDRQLVIYRGLEGLSHDEVGELVGITPENSAKRWQRLRERLRQGFLED